MVQISNVHFFEYLHKVRMGDSMQDSFEHFREFVKDKPYLQKKVKNKETTWQELYEHYDLYGEEDTIFSEPKVEEPEKKNESKEKEQKDEDSIASLFGLLSGLDVDKLSDGLNGMKKVLNILSEVTKGDEDVNFSKRKQSRPYQKEDD